MTAPIISTLSGTVESTSKIACAVNAQPADYGASAKAQCNPATPVAFSRRTSPGRKGLTAAKLRGRTTATDVAKSATAMVSSSVSPSMGFNSVFQVPNQILRHFTILHIFYVLPSLRHSVLNSLLAKCDKFVPLLEPGPPP